MVEYLFKVLVIGTVKKEKLQSYSRDPRHILNFGQINFPRKGVESHPQNKSRAPKIKL